MKVQMIIGVLDLAAGDVAEVPSRVAALWGGFMNGLAGRRQHSATASLSEQDFEKILSGFDIS